MNQNNHFNNLISDINKSTINKDVLNKVNDLTNNNFTFINTKTIKKTINRSNYDHLFNQLNKINKDSFINLNINDNSNIILSILYTINYNEYNLITNYNNILDNIVTELLIEFNNLFKKYNYKKITTKKKLREIIENKLFNNNLFLMILSDYLNLNLVLLNNRLINLINCFEERTTIIIYKDNEDIYNLDSLNDFKILEEIRNKYSKQYKIYETINIKSINNYKLPDLQKMCNDYDIIINPNKKLKQDLYNILLIFMNF